jgi:Mn-dependent DtxR family transcriptional regulator
MDDWWTDVEEDVLRCFDGRGAIPPAEIAVRLGVSEAAATSLLAILAREGRVKICLVSRTGRAERG